MDYDIILYFIIVVLYIILFHNLFKDNIEGLIFTLLFVFTIFAGFKLLYDLYSLSNTAFIKYKSIYQLENFIYIMKNPIIMFVLIVLFVLSLILFITGALNEDILITSGTFLSFTVGLMFIDLEKNIPLVYLYAIPIILILISLMMLLFSISKFSNGSPFREPMKLSPKNRVRLTNVKNLLVAMFFFILLSLITFTFYGKRAVSTSTEILKNDFLDKQMARRDMLLFLCIVITYSLAGYTTYETREIAFLNKIRTDSAI